MMLDDAPLRPGPLGSEVDPLLMSAVAPEASGLIAGIRLASRYANISSSGDSVSYSRRVMMLGIATAALGEGQSDPWFAWFANWLQQLDPTPLESRLSANDRSDAVRKALKLNRRIVVSPKLGRVIVRAREIAHFTAERDLIDLRHLLFAVAEDPGRAFINFGTQPKAADLADLRSGIVDRVAQGWAPKESEFQWRSLVGLEGSSGPDGLSRKSASSTGGGEDGTGHRVPPVEDLHQVNDDEGNSGSGPAESESQSVPFVETLNIGPDDSSPAGSPVRKTETKEARSQASRPGRKGGAGQGRQGPDEQVKSRQGADRKGPKQGAGPGTERTSPEPVDEQPDPSSSGNDPDENRTDFVDDDAELDQDRLERSVLAIGLARRLHSVWRRTNDRTDPARPAGQRARPVSPPPSDSRSAHEGSRAAFVLHLDAPWGGGKTTFANFLTRVLNPCPEGAQPAGFLRERYGEDADLGGIFLEDPPGKDQAEQIKDKYGPDSRRRWITVYFNAWQMEHIRPPWWAFYQAIRQSCFDAIRREGDAPWDPCAKPGLRGWFPRLVDAVEQLRRFDRWLGLWSDEIGWRFTNPKIYSLLITAAVSLLLVGLLYWAGAWGTMTTKDGSKASFLLGSPLGLILTGVGGVTGLWGLSALVTESIVPGTDSLSERLNLGSGDPFGRFRRHFASTMRRLRRPVLVVVDDLDRCQPAFVVDLIRGIQTLLRSPRVVFVILGDREWIERAFESQHESMSKLDVGPEQTFGARFVEKAIQMSFVLPALGADARLGFVRHVVLGDRAKAAAPKVRVLDQGIRARIREFVNKQAAKRDVDTFDTKSVLDLVGEQFWSVEEGAGTEGSIGAVLDQAGVEKGSAALEQIVSETLAIHAATDVQTEQDVRHELERFARYFPANPRQIKRIINSITIYYAVAIQRPDVPTDPRFRSQLAMWIILMTEWPQTWRLLASYPDLVTVLTAPDPMKALRRQGLLLPGSVKATEAALAPILADRELMALITGTGSTPPHDPLDASEVHKLAELTPLHSRVRRLAEPQPPTASSRRTASPRAARTPASAG